MTISKEAVEAVSKFVKLFRVKHRETLTIGPFPTGFAHFPLPSDAWPRIEEFEVMLESAIAALPFLALRPAPSQSDEARAAELFEWFIRWVGWSVSKETPQERILALIAAVRAEERERIEAAVRSAPCLDEDGKVIATSVVIDAVRAEATLAGAAAEREALRLIEDYDRRPDVNATNAIVAFVRAAARNP